MPGVKVNYIKVGGGGDMLRAIAAKGVDFGGLGNPPTAIGVARKLPIKGIMVLNMLDYVESMAVRTSKNIKSLNYNNKVFSYKVDFSNKSSTNKFARKIKKIHKIKITLFICNAT